MSSEAAEEPVPAAKQLGPTDVDPYALIWEEQPPNVLRSFIVFFPDTEGFDKSAEQVKDWTQEQLVAECERIQEFCPKAIDKPWVAVVQEAFADGGQDASFESWQWSLKDSQELAKLARIQQKVKEKLKGKGRVQPEQSSPAFNLRSRAKAAPRKRGSSSIVLDKDSELVDGSSQDEAREDGRGRASGRSSVRFDKSPPRKRQSQQINSEESSESEHKRKGKGRSTTRRRSTTERSASAGRRQARQSSGQDQILEAVKAMAKQARGRSRSKRSKRRSSRRASRSSDGSSSSSSSESSDSSSSEESESGSDSGDSESSAEAKKRRRKAKSRGRSKRSRGRSRQERRRSRRGDARARAGESVRYQLHALRNEVRGAKPENAASIHELFAAWAALANIQSEVDTARSVYGPTRLPRVLEEAKQQCLDDFKLAAGMLHEGQSKAELLRTAEKMVINSLVQQSRKQVLVRKFRGVQDGRQGGCHNARFRRQACQQASSEPREQAEQRGARRQQRQHAWWWPRQGR